MPSTSLVNASGTICRLSLVKWNTQDTWLETATAARCMQSASELRQMWNFSCETTRTMQVFTVHDIFGFVVQLQHLPTYVRCSHAHIWMSSATTPIYLPIRTWCIFIQFSVYNFMHSCKSTKAIRKSEFNGAREAREPTERRKMAERMWKSFSCHFSRLKAVNFLHETKTTMCRQFHSMPTPCDSIGDVDVCRYRHRMD